MIELEAPPLVFDHGDQRRGLGEQKEEELQWMTLMHLDTGQKKKTFCRCFRGRKTAEAQLRSKSSLELLEGAQFLIWNKEELITKQTKGIAHFLQTMDMNIRTEDEDQTLLATVQDLKEREKSLRSENGNYKLLLSKSLTENELLSEDIHTLRVNEKTLYKANKSLTKEMGHLESLRDKNEGEIDRLRKEVSALQCQLDGAQDVLRDRDEKTRELSHVISLMDKEKEEVQQLTDALHGRQEHDKLVADCLTELESLRETHAKENEDLKAAMEELQSDLEEALLLISDTDEIATKQSGRIADLSHYIEVYMCTDDMKSCRP